MTSRKNTLQYRQQRLAIKEFRESVSWADEYELVNLPTINKRLALLEDKEKPKKLQCLWIPIHHAESEPPVRDGGGIWISESKSGVYARCSLAVLAI